MVAMSWSSRYMPLVLGVVASTRRLMLPASGRSPGAGNSLAGSAVATGGPCLGKGSDDLCYGGAFYFQTGIAPGGNVAGQGRPASAR
jgi:hypothetical protein